MQKKRGKEMSEFKELVKNFSSVRSYMRDFYLYGFKCRNEFGHKSPRTYDNERRRLEIWLEDYVEWEYTARGKNLFLSIDSGAMAKNPLYAAWKSKSFTDNDITLHFYLLAILNQCSGLTSVQITEEIDRQFGILFEAQTVRNKLKEYEAMGILESEKKGKALYYKLPKETKGTALEKEKWLEAIAFFSEAAPFGIIGSTILDREDWKSNLFRWKHHFIVHTLEDEILLQMIEAMNQGREIEVENISRRTGIKSFEIGIPIGIRISTQTGRRYLCLYREKQKRCSHLRLDYIEKVKIGNLYPNYQETKNQARKSLKFCWGVSQKITEKKDYIQFTIVLKEGKEDFIWKRLEREKRMGKVEKIAEGIYAYEAEVSDANEMMPWIKTFLGRIGSFSCTDKELEKKFYNDMKRMATYYGQE